MGLLVFMFQLPRMCVALTELTADHHNMCCLVQLLPDHPRGNQLRRHLSVGMISKLLDGSCTYKPSGKDFELSYLQPYMPRIKPTSLRSMLSPCSVTKKEGEENMYTLDQQTYYLCYSLLTLVNQASNFLFFPPHQKEQLMMLCTELDRHIKRDMKENDKCLYRSKVGVKVLLI
ncbi:SMC5-SMC6 complex localization factor protein 2 [Merluccius polli]|uniref:SMC5-SMC6 complex localization factor protein 2 n=1 Tax=Merluccius polli TaxID=89951 RepID=A0AA47NMI9_MERPO|nr:SMC5-SMC6 complex localization factor protein 2 [Merluccius polli]